MKRLILALTILLAPCLADANTCGVSVCNTPFVATNYAVPLAVPVAQYSPVSYSYDARPINVTVNLNSDQIAQAVVDKLNAPVAGEKAAAKEPDVFAPPPASAVTANCAGCHAAGKNATAVAKIDLSNLRALSCENKLAAIRAVVSGSMPKGRKLDDQAIGHLIEELSQ